MTKGKIFSNIADALSSDSILPVANFRIGAIHNSAITSSKLAKKINAIKKIKFFELFLLTIDCIKEVIFDIFAFLFIYGN